MLLVVKVKPNARQSLLQQQPDGTWIAQLKAPPVDGRANEELVRVVAEHFGCMKREVRIVAGAGGRLKRVEVPG